MRDELAEAQKARVMALHHAWARPLGLLYQVLTYRWHRGAIPNYPEATMTVDPDWQYGRALIHVDLTESARLSDEELRFAFVHEMMHVFLAGLIEGHRLKVDQDAFRLIEEHTASMLARGVIWVHDLAGDPDTKPAQPAGQQEDGPEEELSPPEDSPAPPWGAPDPYATPRPDDPS